MPHVFNKRTGFSSDYFTPVYIGRGRGNPYGNPFVIGRDGDRDEVCEKFKRWFFEPAQADLRKRVREELCGRDLLCWCAPERVTVIPFWRTRTPSFTPKRSKSSSSS